MNAKIRALQLVAIQTEKERYKYLDCNTKSNSSCILRYSNERWTIEDDSFPQVKYRVLGKCDSKEIDSSLFQDNLPVYSHDNSDDLLNNGKNAIIGRIYSSVLNNYSDFATVVPGDIILIEEIEEEQ